MQYSYLVSIVIPLYNNEKEISTCIKSILLQSYSNYEIIVVDDGSTDKSNEVISGFCKNHSQIKYFYQNNKGVSQARNKGISICKGDFILFVDADDSIAPDFVENLISNYEDEDDIVICGLTKVFKDLKLEKVSAPKVGSFSKKQILENFLFHQSKFGFYGFVCSKLIKTEIVKSNNIQFDENIKLAEDLDFFIQYYHYCKNFKLVSGNGYYYSQNPNSDSKKNVDYIQLISVYLKLKQMLADADCLNKDNYNILKHLFSEFKFAHFNEMKRFRKKDIEYDLKKLRDFEIIKKNNIIRWLVEKEFIHGLIAYLKIRLFYIKIKRQI